MFLSLNESDGTIRVWPSMCPASAQPVETDSTTSPDVRSTFGPHAIENRMAAIAILSFMPP